MKKDAENVQAVDIANASIKDIKKGSYAANKRNSYKGDALVKLIACELLDEYLLENGVTNMDFSKYRTIVEGIVCNRNLARAYLVSETTPKRGSYTRTYLHQLGDLYEEVIYTTYKDFSYEVAKKLFRGCAFQIYLNNAHGLSISPLI